MRVVRALEGTPSHLVRLEAIYLLALAVAAAASGGRPCPAAQAAGLLRAEVAFLEFASWSSSALLALALSVTHPILALVPAASSALASACAPFSLGSADLSAAARLAGSQVVLLAASMGLAERDRQLSPSGVAERGRSTVKFLRGAVPVILAASLIPSTLGA